MRDIVFKAKRIDNGEWVEGSLLQTTAVSLKSFIVESSCYTFEKWDWNECVQVDEDTICQYTGLTDKNGNKIWENDIVVAHFRSNKSRQKFKIIFEDGMFLFDNSCVEVPKYDVYGIKVIGNIFDNPELIGEQNG